MRDLLLSPPAENPYSVLKAQLTKCTTLSEQRKLQQLFTGEELGDRKLRRMQHLLGDRLRFDASFLRELFLQRLPPNVRTVLASSPEVTTLDQMAEMADKVMEVASPSIAALSKPPASGPAPPPALADELRQFHSDMSRLEKLVTRLACNRSSSRSNQHSSRHSHTPPPTEDPLDYLCWYHHKFVDHAQKCRTPCTWSLNEQAGH